MRLHSDERLLEAVIADLETRLLPALAEEQRFRVRLDVNALKMVLRSLQRGGEQAAAEAADAQLAQRIRSREVRMDDTQVLEQIEAGLSQRLAVHNPKWLR